MSSTTPILRVLHPREEVEARIDDLARRLRADLPGRCSMVVIEEGGRFFAEALRERLEAADIELCVHGLRVHRSRGTQLVEPRMAAFDAETIAGAWTLVVDDIADEGRTLEAVLRLLRNASPMVLRTAVLVDKPVRRRCPVRLDYVGFTVPDLWMVGCGMDLDGKHRDRPELCYLEQAVSR